MASVITHSLIGLAAGAAVPGLPKTKRFWALCALCPSIPDADTIGFRFGIHYEDMLGHRGFTHSILFALLLGVAVATTEFRRPPPANIPKRAYYAIFGMGITKVWSPAWLWVAAFFAAITMSHGFLDAMTDGGMGVGFFIPFSAERYFFPWTPIEVSPIGVKQFFSARGLAVIRSELVYVWVPALALLAAAKAITRAGTRRF